jgi:Fe-S cluster assembly ATP-binding protein
MLIAYLRSLESQLIQRIQAIQRIQRIQALFIGGINPLETPSGLPSWHRPLTRRYFALRFGSPRASPLGPAPSAALPLTSAPRLRFNTPASAPFHSGSGLRFSRLAATVARFPPIQVRPTCSAVIRPEAPVLLEIRDLHASVADQPILHGVNLIIRAGEIHAVMGRNGSGKSTLSKVLAGHPAYSVTGGSVSYRGEDLLALAPELRARRGVFLGFQYPVEIPGVSNLEFLRVATNGRRLEQGVEELDTFAFEDLVRERLAVVQMDPAFLERSVNEGFSGGEKKRNEILQMALLDPLVAILDETDSGLDIDALRIVAGGVNQLASPDNATLLITHYQRLLDVITPDYVHVMAAGRILRTGGKELALELEDRGYDWVDAELAALAPAPVEVG